MALNGISTLIAGDGSNTAATKILRRDQKLALASQKRQLVGTPGYRVLNTISGTHLAYVNGNAGAQIATLSGTTSPTVGRPWALDAVVWTPALLFAANEYGAWYEPSDLTTLFQDAAGTIPVTAAGQSVGLMRDKSGNDLHVAVTDNSYRPTLTQDINGRYCLQFDGVDDHMTAVTPAYGLTVMDTWVVFQESTEVSGAGMLTFAPAAGSDDTQADALTLNTGDASHLWSVTSRTLNPEIFGSGATPLAVWELSKRDVVADITRNGGSLVVDSGFDALDATHSGDFFIGARYQGDALTNYFNGCFYGAVIRNATSTIQDTLDARTYMGALAGLNIPPVGEFLIVARNGDTVTSRDGLPISPRS